MRFFDPMGKMVFLSPRYPGTKEKSLIFQSDNHIFMNDSFKFTKDDVFVHKIGIGFIRNSINFKLFRDEFEKLFESGIHHVTEQKLFKDKLMKSLKVVAQEIEIKVLTLEDLESGFVIWLIAVLITIIIFICEKIYFKITNEENWTKSKVVEEKNQKRKKKSAKKERPKIKTKFINVKIVKINGF